LLSGYEVAHSNAAYILRRKLKSSPLLASPAAASSYVAVPATQSAEGQGLQPVSAGSSSGDSAATTASFSLKDVLFAKALERSSQLGNLESTFELGHLFFDGRGVRKDRTVASWWYSKASAAGHSLSKSHKLRSNWQFHDLCTDVVVIP
jgi:TPR repeat protein